MIDREQALTVGEYLAVVQMEREGAIVVGPEEIADAILAFSAEPQHWQAPPWIVKLREDN